MNDDLIPLIRSIDAHLGVIAAYAQHLLTKETGLKEVRVTGYVRSRNAGGEMLHLYTDHPAVLKRVGRLYEEHFALMPFDPTVGKVFEGEAAPSRDWAEKNGYLVHVTPFTALYTPTGKTTDNGQPTYRFQRILTLDPPPTPSAHPSHPPTPSTPSAHPSHPPILSSRTAPLAPGALRAWLQQTTATNTSNHRAATDAQTGHVHSGLVSAIPNEAARRRFQEWLMGHPSMKEWSRSQVLAIHTWLKPSPQNGPTDPFAVDEINDVLDYLRDYIPHPLFTTAQDAITWAFDQGAFPDPATARAAYTARWIEWRRPSVEDMLSRWADYIPTLIPS